MNIQDKKNVILIKEFVTNLKDINQKKTEKFNPNLNNDKVSQIVEKLQKKDVAGLLDEWKEFLACDYFQLPHPENSNVLTTAIYSHRVDRLNFVIMSDRNFENIWIFSQLSNFFQELYTESTRYVIFGQPNPLPEGFVRVLNNLIDHVSNLGAIKCYKFAGFDLAESRPYHFFYDHLKYFYALGGVKVLNKYNKGVKATNSFYFPNEYESILKEEGVFLLPVAIEELQCTASQNITIKTINKSMEDMILEENIMHNPANKDALYIWIGITGQERSWLQQIEGYTRIIDNLSLYYSKIILFIDGWTSFEMVEKKEITSDKEISSDNKVFEAIKSKLKSNCDIYSMTGSTYKEKIKYCSSVDLVIQNSGSGAIVPLRICQKQGVYHHNIDFTQKPLFTDTYKDTIKFPNVDFISNNPLPNVHIAKTSYHIPWQHIYNLAAEVLNQTKNMNIKMLEVPPVEEVVKEYELKNKKNKG